MRKHIKRPIPYGGEMRKKCLIFFAQNITKNICKITKMRRKREIIHIYDIQIFHFTHKKVGIKYNHKTARQRRKWLLNI